MKFAQVGRLSDVMLPKISVKACVLTEIARSTARRQFRSTLALDTAWQSRATFGYSVLVAYSVISGSWYARIIAQRIYS